jgi:hypothetical protein
MDDLWMRLAWWLPKRLVYFCAVRVMATTGEYGSEVTPSLLAMNALKRWPR